MNKTIVIYHGNCLDGFAAAWAAWLVLGDEAEYVPGIYGTAPPNVDGCNVYLLDFSYKRPILLDMLSKAKSLTILDHHKSAAEDLAGITDIPHNAFATVMFDMEKSGAQLAWAWFHPKTNVPPIIDYVADRDLWHFRYPETRAINAVLFSYPYEFAIFTKLAGDVITIPERMVDSGEAIERKHHKDISELVVLLRRKRIIAGHEVWCANLPYTMASDAAGMMAADGPFGATFYINNADEAVFSLRSRGVDSVDVAKVAEKFGGGGHRSAAGFKVPAQAVLDGDLNGN